jgi:hypothetical protein
MMHRYWAYGLRICSEIAFPELLQINHPGAADVYISLGDPFSSLNAIDMGKPLSIVNTENYTAIGVKDIAVYEICGGKRIIVHPRPSATSSDIRVYCLSNAFAVLLYQRKCLPLHAGGIIQNNQVTLVMGASRSGKSTLMHRMMQRGYQVFSDDVVVADTTIHEKVRVHASYPMMKLWADQMRAMGHPMGAPIRSGVEKFPCYFHSQFDSQPRSVANIVLLDTSTAIQSCELRRLVGSETLIETMRNIYRREWMPESMAKLSVGVLLQLIKNSACFEITRPPEHQSEDEMTRIFTSILGEKK